MTRALPILLLAAGASRRMGGRDKLLEPVAGGVPLLAERVAAARATGHEVWVALPPESHAPQRWRCSASAHRLEIPHPEEGMGASLAQLVAALPETAEGAMVLPADMPDITSADMTRLLAAFDPDRVARGATARGTPGHPVLFPRSWFSRLARITGDTGARDLLRAAPARLVPLPGENARTDLDTPEQWAAWRATLQPGMP